jgi:hypothetical protein
VEPDAVEAVAVAVVAVAVEPIVVVVCVWSVYMDQRPVLTVWR